MWRRVKATQTLEGSPCVVGGGTRDMRGAGARWRAFRSRLAGHLIQNLGYTEALRGSCLRGPASGGGQVLGASWHGQLEMSARGATLTGFKQDELQTRVLDTHLVCSRGPVLLARTLCRASDIFDACPGVGFGGGMLVR